MNIKDTSTSLLKEFAPQMGPWSWKGKTAVVILSAILLWGLYALYIQVFKGHGVTGMRDNVVWGLYIANFVFFIGISYAGAIISGILHLLRVNWRKPILRIAELITVIATIIGPIYILLCVGRLDRLHHLFMYGRIQSPITWDVLAISTYLVGSIIFLYLALIRDFAILSETNEIHIPNWRRKIYKLLSINFRNTPEQVKRLKLTLDVLSAIIIPTAIIVHSVLSWIFGMTLRPGWHSTIFGPYFVLAAIFSGTGVMIIVMYVFRNIYNLKRYLTDQHFRYMGYMLIVLAAGYGYFTFSEYLTDWYTSEKWDAELIDKLFSFEHYGWWFYFANFGGILVPLILIGIPKFRSVKTIVFSSVVLVAALWIKRYLIVVPTLENTLLPMQDLRPEYISYSATWVEWALTAAGVAAFILFFILMSRFVPIVPVWETSEYLEEIKLKTSDEKVLSEKRAREVKQESISVSTS
ncbi:MAG: polysulfide reductase NrfD [Cyclobacteriaceae bacterium]|nr:polysulfide reductase NrfD [Cyclobacteriaceae bacterium]